ncbi:Methylmalonic aciduria type A protein, mitochondrial [Holothuria leucospilota]|uniref:Methylmalonic aciduria type A protein, mitochondrial n=1 Tax=Holothuria leucospilota TaxID=206669 RepID=A0A9Q1BLB9_HOLLE|nr:Methylmalonic aciduria type A protein, mitochondrial [Holothuria leucospilota]
MKRMNHRSILNFWRGFRSLSSNCSRSCRWIGRTVVCYDWPSKAETSAATQGLNNRPFHCSLPAKFSSLRLLSPHLAIKESLPSLSVRNQQIFCNSHTSQKSFYSNGVLLNSELAENLLLKKERWALAKAITLIESTNNVKRKQAQELMNTTLKQLKTEENSIDQPKSFRIGLTGPPGAGKSTFIETFGKMLTQSGYKVAVLAVDPSSSVSGGSLLGDKTRMPELTRDPNAYIRASPSCGTLGGVTRTTNETILLCEGAGYDVILVETVGVGQSEYVVADMVDLLVLIIPPAGGDELQGIKRGIVERTDMILVNKADGELLIPARRVRGEYTSAIKLMRQRSSLWKPKVLQVSSKTGNNLDKAWSLMKEFKETMVTNGLFQSKRKRQQIIWMWNHIEDRVLEAFKEDGRISSEIEQWEKRVLSGDVTPGMAADALLERYLPQKNK